MVKPFNNVTNSLTQHLVIIVPSTDYDKSVGVKKREEETQRVLSKLFGGTTSVRAVGTYMSQEGKLIKERVSEVEIFTTPQAWEKNKDALTRWLLAKKREWKQEALAIKYEEDMFWV